MHEHAYVGPGPDAVLYAPAKELTGTELDVDDLRATVTPNRYEKRGSEFKRRGRRELEHAAVDLYGGWDNLLVRTALIRAEKYSDRRLPRIGSSEDVARLCKHLIYADNEHMVTVALDGQSRCRAIHEAAIGPAGHAVFTAQQVLKVAFLTGANAFVMVHNHPSGDPNPSPEDLQATTAVAEAAQCVGLTMLDHVVVAERGFFSFSWSGEVRDFANRQEVYAVQAKPTPPEPWA
ncbi:MAG: JAB domain-containing protein [Gammaproteobacteria bacterium]|nr:JAB domain-containing protein [Gammaproteobacteria bacterium]NIR82379.1 JAB domain-containing protein [Gammaproteobacteria bacterium]NIU03524.1 JAB domain-containing protein [Gammaproteobacteria bacterium]NIX84798.1 hypothetical protein [Gammaproteobacteria bacterium]